MLKNVCFQPKIGFFLKKRLKNILFLVIIEKKREKFGKSRKKDYFCIRH